MDRYTVILNAELMEYLGSFKAFIKVFHNDIIGGLNGEILCISKCWIAWSNEQMLQDKTEFCFKTPKIFLKKEEMIDISADVDLINT